MRTLISIVLTGALMLGATLLLPACGGGDDGGEETPEAVRLSVYTSCYPVDWMTRRVAGEHADVTNILPVGEDPPEWTPPAEVVTAMQGADLVVINGATFEGWVATTTLPQDKLVDTTAALKGQLIEIQGETHSHGKGGEHTHAGTDPHTWSDPLIAIEQAVAIKNALAAADPGHAEAFEANLAALKAELEALDGEYKAALAGYDGQVLATSHPAFNYLGQRYGLKLDNYGFEPGEEPEEEQFHHFEHHVEEHGTKLMLWESMPGDELKQKFEATGVTVVFLDPLEQPPEGASYDYLAQARANVATLQGLFGEKAAEPEDTAADGG